MAFWKLKLFKTGQKVDKYSEVGNNIHFREENNEEKTDYVFRGRDGDLPNRDSINSLEQAYANLPLVKSKPPAELIVKRQSQSLTMEEARRLRQQQAKQQATPPPVNGKFSPSDNSPENSTNTPSSPRRSSDFDLPKDDQVPTNLPSWRNEKLDAVAKATVFSPLLSNSVLPLINGKQYSPTLSSKSGEASSPGLVKNLAKTEDVLSKEKNLHISSIPIPYVQQQQNGTPCYVVNSPCMFTGSYPCYVMNVMNSTPYVPVQIYPMMLVPNQQPNNSNPSQRMVY